MEKSRRALRARRSVLEAKREVVYEHLVSSAMQDAELAHAATSNNAHSAPAAALLLSYGRAALRTAALLLQTELDALDARIATTQAELDAFDAREAQATAEPPPPLPSPPAREACRPREMCEACGEPVRRRPLIRLLNQPHVPSTE